MTEPSDIERAEDPTDEMRADELASAFVDGSLTDEEADEVRADPELMARVAEFRAVAAAVGDPVTPPPDAMKAAHIAAAMAAFDAGAAAPTTATTETAATEAAANATNPSTVSSTESASPPIDLRDRKRERAERGNRMLLTLAAAFVVIAGIGLASWGLGSSSDDDVAIAVGDSDDASEGPVSPSNAGATEALEAEAMADDEAMEDEDMAEDAMEEAFAADADTAAAESEVTESGDDSADGESDDSAPLTTTIPSADEAAEESADEAEPLGVLRLAEPPSDQTIDDLFAQSGDAEPLPLEESACAATLGVVDGAWFIVETADGALVEFIVERTADGAEIGRLVDETCAVVLP